MPTLAEKVQALGGFEAVRERIRKAAEGGPAAIRERLRNGTQPEDLGLTPMEILCLTEAELSVQLIGCSGSAAQGKEQMRIELVKAGVDLSVVTEFLELSNSSESKSKRVN